MINFILGILFGSMIFEPIIINLIYFTNIGLFLDIVLTEKNRFKLKKYFHEIEKD